MLQQLRRDIGIDYDQRTQGILHFYTSAAELAAAEGPAAQMRALGCDRRLITVDEALAIEPALRHIAPKLAGATYTAQDESGDANRFARELVEHCQADGVRFLMSHTVTALRAAAGKLEHVEATDSEGRFQFLHADAYVLAMGSWSPLYVRSLGIRLPIYPAKGYSVTMPVRDATRAFQVSLTDDEHKIVFSRLGDKLRIAGTAELNGYDRDLESRALRGDRAAHRRAVPRRRRHGARAVLDGLAPRDTVERADHRPLEAAESLPEHGPRHARLDARLRLRQEHRAHRQRPEARGRVSVRRRLALRASHVTEARPDGPCYGADLPMSRLPFLDIWNIRTSSLGGRDFRCFHAGIYDAFVAL